MDEMKTLIAFDFGEKRIGTAIGQTVTRTATPLETITVHGTRPDWNAIDRLIDTWKPDALVVGLPLNMDGTEQWITAHARRFANRLHGRSGLPVHLADERLSTREAWTRLIESGSRRDGPDPVAAQVILEGWLAGDVVVRSPEHPAGGRYSNVPYASVKAMFRFNKRSKSKPTCALATKRRWQPGLGDAFPKPVHAPSSGSG